MKAAMIVELGQQVLTKCNWSALRSPNRSSSVTIPTMIKVGRSLSEIYNPTSLLFN